MVARLWPSVLALVIVFLSRSALAGLLAGAAAGALLLSDGRIDIAFVSFFRDHLVPSLQSGWNISVIIFTLLIGGFAGVIEHGGGFSQILRRVASGGKSASTRLQWAAFGMGLVCFFDGLANSMLVGRVVRPMADRVGLSREKLSYLVDSTSSPIACVSCISTWIAYQLSMIREGLAAVDMAGNAYILFVRSIPFNFYCLFTLMLVALTIAFRIDIGAMDAAERRAASGRASADDPGDVAGDDHRDGRVSAALAPLAVMIGSMITGLYISGAGGWIMPRDLHAIADAFGNADTALVLVCCAAISGIVACLMNPAAVGAKTTATAFADGMTRLFSPVIVLLCAWCLSSTLKQLGAATALTDLLSGHLPVAWLPAAVFALGALISFSTGTSWGTMGVMMPLALPLSLALPAAAGVQEPVGSIAAMTIAAVFSGAVFGDHCSPISDTTIVSAIACDLETVDHVRTQLPYAVLASLIALGCGFIPCGFGLSPVIALAAGAAVLVAVVWVHRRFGQSVQV